MDPRDQADQQQEAYNHQPFDIEVEQALLGQMITDNRRIDIAAAEMAAEDFYDPLHARIFDAIVYMSTEGEVTPLILHAVMKSDPGYITLGMDYFGVLAAAAPTITSVRNYCTLLKDLAEKRRLIKVGEELIHGAHEPPLAVTARMLADRAAEALLQIGEGNAKPRRTVHQIAMATVARLEKHAQGEPMPMVKTGFEKVDDELGGLRGGDLAVILGKSGMGKSALMGCLALNAALSGVPTIVFSLEMTEDQWVERLVCDYEFGDGSPRPLWYSRVRNGNLNDGEFDRFMLTAMKLENDMPLEIVDDDGLTIQQISARARAFKAKHKGKLGLVMIDYLQIVEPSDSRENRERQVNAIARGAKALAKKLGWPVVAGSQMNEGDTTRSKEEKRPQPGDARESKGILHEADLMLSPYRPAYWVEIRKPMDVPPGSPDWNKWVADLKAVRNRFELLVLKNRHGRKKDFELYCEMGASAIRNSEPHRPMAPEEEAERDLLEGLTL